MPCSGRLSAWRLLPLAAVPDLLVPISDFIGIEYEPATVLFAATAFLFATTVHLSYEMSRVEARTQDLAEELALLRVEVEAINPRANSLTVCYSAVGDTGSVKTAWR